ncbi:uncharacterized protein LOC131615049 [Vicia villosa]|uniref:uncharacterized protein LOC131615049 n=1 Tax=Vicia villosa TaxID=3911 RepID=UPI00273C8043|nr:uncharacterized protein LOC131615049 [Vicia villosa]
MTNNKNQEAAIKSLETQHCKAVVTRTGQKGSNNETEKNVVEDNTEEEAEKHDGEDEEYEIINTNAEEENVNKEVKKKEKLKRRSSREKLASNVIPSQHLPYPHVPSKKDHAKQYASAIISHLPQKARDPGRVTLPVTIGNQNIGNGIIDLGSSINLIPLSIVKRLGNIEMKSTRMTLQLADKSTTLPYGVAQDMLVKVDKFLFPVDFVVIDMEEDKESPIILGRPFMKTVRMMIDIDDGIMKLRVQDEEVCFNLYDAMKQPKDKNDCFRMDATEESAVEVANHIHLSSPLERSLVESFNIKKEINLSLSVLS